MNLLLIGGHTRNIGKTALVVDIIRAFPQAGWTAVKITQYGHGVCSINGEACGCAPNQHTFSLDEETSRENKTDTSRFLVAGALCALWLRTKQGYLAEALPMLRDAVNEAGNVIIESNSLMNFVRPRLYVVVMEPARTDFKESARLHLPRADALVLRSEGKEQADLATGTSSQIAEDCPVFHQPLGTPLPEGFCNFMRERYFLRNTAAPSGHLSS